MEPYQERVIDEKKQLDEKIESLADFLKMPAFGELDWIEQARLTHQFAVMTTYSTILGERIDAFKG